MNRIAEVERVQRPRLIVYGYFKAMGDLLSAAPVIRHELEAGHQVVIFASPGKGLEQFLSLIDFGPLRARLDILPAPVRLASNVYREFFRRAAQWSPMRFGSPPMPHRRHRGGRCRS